MSVVPMAPLALPISCFIIAKNEADRIGATIRSVKELVDEVIVVDSGSTDGTEDVARALGARVQFNEWPGFGQQKRFAEALCRHDWILNLDADEIVVPELAAEIRAAFAAGTPFVAGFKVNALVVYPGQARPRPFARDHQVIRLYDRRRIRYKDSTLFDSVDPKGEPTAWFRAPLFHHSVRSFDDLIAKCDERATYNAGNAKTKNRGLLALRLVTEYPAQFLKYYLWRTHIFGGLNGFQFARIVAFYRYVRVLRMWEGASAHADQLNTRPHRGPTSSPATRDQGGISDR